MLIPVEKPLFENVSSREYYARAGEIKNKALSAVIRIIFPDFEEAIIFSDGKAVAAIHESGRWMTVGDELIDVAENKALAIEGRMSAYEITPAAANIFIHKSVKTMVETELGKYMTPRLLIGYLESDKSTCILKLQDKRGTGYVLINFGKQAGAVYESANGRTYGESAIKDMDRFREHTYAAIYFMEAAEKYLKSRPEAPVTTKPAETVAPPAPAPAPAPAPTAPAAPAAPFPTETVKPGALPIENIKPSISRPLTVPMVPKSAGVRLIVAMSDDRHIGLAHRSRQHTLEVLEESDVAWVDRKTLASLHAYDLKASLILPDGREYAVTLEEAAIKPAESRYVILPRKLRDRLSIAKGTTVEIKA
jgi:hypothetical protein